MHRHHRGRDQADRVLGERPDHLLAPLAEDQFGVTLLISHWANPLARA
jgi:hypothetical protein